jgi:hypothetical protein
MPELRDLPDSSGNNLKIKPLAVRERFHNASGVSKMIARLIPARGPICLTGPEKKYMVTFGIDFRYNAKNFCDDR